MKSFYYFIILGAPGSGKGTQGDIISKKFNLLKVSPGEILRKIVKDSPSDSISITIESYIGKGNLVPIEIINQVLQNYIENYKNLYQGILFDGYPRNLEQYSFLNSHIATKGINCAIYLQISLNQLFDRLLCRQICTLCGCVFNTKYLPSKNGANCDKCGGQLSGRTDDANKQIIENRFNVFNSESMPLIENYKILNKLITVDADRNVKDISDELDKLFKNLLNV